MRWHIDRAGFFSEMNTKQVLRFGLPKGSLQEATIEKMAKAGYNISVSSRSYIPYVDDS
jgi:ATP phosphoribosyltransferase